MKVKSGITVVCDMYDSKSNIVKVISGIADVFCDMYNSKSNILKLNLASQMLFVIFMIQNLIL